MIFEVLSAENDAVDMVKMKTPQSATGSQIISGDGPGFSTVRTESFGMGKTEAATTSGRIKSEIRRQCYAVVRSTSRRAFSQLMQPLGVALANALPNHELVPHLP
ncbi:MAG TPA: hypothetical protein VKR29_09160, partial [Candidatus Binataceae bacterium]|nr:hypothetical protein [Candidatus Binataceae bacterium]